MAHNVRHAGIAESFGNEEGDFNIFALLISYYR